MRKSSLIAAIALSWAAHAAYAGGTIGGTGTLSNMVDVLAVMSGPLDQPDLGLEKLTIPASDFRRARARLSVADETTVHYKGEDLAITKHAGGITDKDLVRQLVPQQD